eukprot:scaffold56737_cov75-Attheya_sp.AAC.3
MPEPFCVSITVYGRGMDKPNDFADFVGASVAALWIVVAVDCRHNDQIPCVSKAHHLAAFAGAVESRVVSLQQMEVETVCLLRYSV